jgi:hypothetical protein
MIRDETAERALIHLPEPMLRFGYHQDVEDPRDGLSLFGPLDKGKPYGIRAGVVGTAQGVAWFGQWVKRIQKPILSAAHDRARPPFPGLQAVFGIPWNPAPEIELHVPEDELRQAAHIDDRHQRVHRTVRLYSERIITALREEEVSVDVWFVIVPQFVYENCRPQSVIGRGVRVQSDMSLRQYEEDPAAPFLFDAAREASRAFAFEPHFHNQLKARLLEGRALTQIVREPTIMPLGLLEGDELKQMQAMESSIAWTLSAQTFYKAGGRPWKLSNVRPGVCYVGLVFKRDAQSRDPRNACCAAQMFLDSGDGLVFKGAVGPWYNPDTREYHLTRDAAHELIAMAIESYRNARSDGRRRSGKRDKPRELFIHGRIRFNREEWSGFLAGTPRRTRVVGVGIWDDPNEKLKLFTKGAMPVL